MFRIFGILKLNGQKFYQLLLKDADDLLVDQLEELAFPLWLVLVIVAYLLGGQSELPLLQHLVDAVWQSHQVEIEVKVCLGPLVVGDVHMLAHLRVLALE